MFYLVSSHSTEIKMFKYMIVTTSSFHVSQLCFMTVSKYKLK